MRYPFSGFKIRDPGSGILDRFRLPACFCYPRDLTLKGHITEHIP